MLTYQGDATGKNQTVGNSAEKVTIYSINKQRIRKKGGGGIGNL